MGDEETAEKPALDTWRWERIRFQSCSETESNQARLLLTIKSGPQLSWGWQAAQVAKMDSLIFHP